MTQTNLVETNNTAALIDLVDNASRYALQAQAALVVLTANDEFHKLNSETLDLVLWAVTDRLEDLENLFSEQVRYRSKNGRLFEQASKFAGQAMQIIIAHQDGSPNSKVNPHIFSNALWLVSDRITDVINLIEQINIKEAA